MQKFFEPAAVVLIGVSRQTGPGAYNNLEMLLSYGYQGRIYLVHPKVTEILGHRTYPRVADLPEVPDLAVISLGRERVAPAFAECAAHGIRRVVVISQGFADADERGRELQAQLVALAREHGVRFLGPNTMGVLNPFAGFSTAFVDIPREASPVPLTMVAQSGVFQVGASSSTGQMGKAIDVGNAGDVDVVDVLEYLEHDAQTRIIVLHLEGMKQGRRFLEVAGRIVPHKPIIALKTGRSAAGARAAMSHTGSMVGEDAVFDLAFRQAGIIRARSLVELRAMCTAFLHFRPMSGPRLGMVTATGAFGIITADACADYGLELAPFPENLRELEEDRIAWHKLHNPVDIWPLGMVTGSFTKVFRRAAEGLLASEQVDGVVGVAPALASPKHSDLDMAALVKELLKSNTGHKPLALLLYGDEAAYRAQCRDLVGEPDVACFDTLEEAVLGLAATWRYHHFRECGCAAESVALPAAAATRPVALPVKGAVLGEAALALLKHYQISTVPSLLAQDAGAATGFAKKTGYPVVLKIISPEWLHKSDLGGVRLNINDEAQLQASFQELLEVFEVRTPEGSLEGILVQKQAKGVELLLGVKQNPQFGPVLAAGAGGVYTEILKDIARGLAPLSRERARCMLAGLKIYPILAGARGQAGVNLEALLDLMMGLSRLAVDYPEIRELDLNPVIANQEGCWAVDWRVVV
ncbi:MAG: acetate--CoA ligase family protein [Deltaproteobacteria bacterium]|nr:acetate--CoA ligase family protein [Deltaproteobacteria bacterium]